MITTNVYQRVFQLRSGSATATCFVIDVDGRQYVITAKHALDDATPTFLEIYFQGKWQGVGVALVGHAPDGSDITVLTASLRLAPPFALEAGSEGIVYGQDVYFLGFPYGMRFDVGPVNRGFPLPFVKRALVSASTTMRPMTWFLDGINNPGFSGGPVVWKKAGENAFRVAAVISGFRFASEPVYEGSIPTDLFYRANTGIILASDIHDALDTIRANPIGLRIKAP